METDWQEVARIPLPPHSLHAAPTPVATLAFDNSQELVWAGNGFGRITSFYRQGLQRYTSYRGHAPQEGPVKQILLCDKGVLSVGTRSVHLASRKGIAIWHLTNEEFIDLRCMSFTSAGTSEILVAGCQPKMFRIDVDKGEVLGKVTSPDHYHLMKRGGQYICAATLNGNVQLLDPKTLQVLKSWKAHMGWINDMDTNGSFLVTCGWSPRQHYGHTLDPLAKVFDLKTLMPLPPVPFHVGAAFIRLHPRMLSTGIIAGQYGQIQLVDIMNSTMVNFRQVDVVDSALLSLDVAPSGEALIVTDSLCTMRLWGSPSRMQFTNYSNPTEFADSESFEKSSMEWNSTKPLSSIGMPYYRDTLLSAWPAHMVFELGSPPIKIDPTVLAATTRSELGAWAPNPRKKRRNQVEDTRSSLEKASTDITRPKFLSEQAKQDPIDGEHPMRRMSDFLEAHEGAEDKGATKFEVPLMYRNVEIKYSRFGVEDFDFEYYNKTKFSGLETHIPNSYANPLLQLLKFTPWIRNLALHHTATTCLYESCLLCEMGFLFDMLEKANGQNCQATNLLKTFSSLSQATTLHLLEEGQQSAPLTLMIQAMARFLLEKISADYRQMSPTASHMDQALTTVAMTSIRCTHCANETVRPGGTYIHDLVYPQKPPQQTQTKGPGGGRMMPGPSFSQILKASVERHEQTRGWCDRCKRYQQMTTRKTVQSLPPVFMINAAVHTNDSKQLWAKKGWLPQEIGIIVDQGQFFSFEGPDLQMHLQRGVHKIVVYELIGAVADVNSGEHQKSHLVSMVNVSVSSPQPMTDNQWHLFNDFLVRKVGVEDALKFDPTWKLPSIVTYQVKPARHHIDNSWKENLDISLLYRKWSLQQDADASRFRTLSNTTERPVPGTPVGIDAEFVALQQEEIEIKADGSRSILRPSRLGLARVSVLRAADTPAQAPSTSNSAATAVAAGASPASATPAEGAGLDCIPFIDDYISIHDPIIDYLTLYSGISPGDLDPKTSPHASTGRLVSLKTAYKKIWLLLNLGCVFVGHGLLKDFRTINIQVPKTQVVDTVELFYLKSRGRKLSLRFLSWLLLGEEVQRGMHDSIEDARTAVKLWRKYKDLQTQGDETVDAVLADIYKRGRELGFKVPNSGPGAAVTMQAAKASSISSSSTTGTPGVSGGSSIGSGIGAPGIGGPASGGGSVAPSLFRSYHTHAYSSAASSVVGDSSAPGTPRGKAAGLASTNLAMDSPSK